MALKIGMELEGHLIDGTGTLSNRASEIIGDSRNNGDIIPELSKTMWEIIAPPKYKLSDVYNSFKDRLEMLKDIADDYNLRVMPASSLHNESEVKSRDYERPRGMRKRIILKDYKRNLEHHLTGAHVHVDRLEDDEKGYKQLLLIHAMDPVFSFMSSSPFFYGKNTLKDYRVELYRNEVFKDLPKQGQLMDYPDSLEDAFENQRECYNEFMEILNKNNLDNDGLDELNCVWGPIRLTKFGTIESRCADSNKLSNLVALAGLYKGISEYIDSENPEVVINGNYPIDKMFIPKDGKIMIPSYEQLKNFEKIGVRYGLEDNNLRDYLANIVKTSSKGLEEVEYIEPFNKMIKDRKNFSDDIVGYAKAKGLEKNDKIDAKGAKILRNYIADSFERDLYN